MGYSREKLKHSLTRKYNPRKGICETLRMIYDEVHSIEDVDKKEAITELLVDAFSMAKKMEKRLIYYKDTYKDSTGHGGVNIPLLTNNRRRGANRRSRE